MNVHIRKAEPSDCEALTKLTFRSKRYWNYPEEYIRIWQDELTVTPEYIIKNTVHIAEVMDETVRISRIAGYYSLVYNPEDRMSGETLVNRGNWIDNFFIDPDFIGQGIGSILMDHLRRTCKEMRLSRLYIFSDPNAKGFYLQQGARFVQDCPSSIPGRTIPMLEMKLDNRERRLNPLNYVLIERMPTASELGDGFTVFYIQDVLVHPEYQRNGIGKAMMQKVMAYIGLHACSKAVVGLMAASGKEEFYKWFGFTERPNESLGAGMTQFWELVGLDQDV